MQDIYKKKFDKLRYEYQTKYGSARVQPIGAH